MGEDRDADPEQGGEDLRAEQAPVPLVGRMGDERDTGGHELGPCRLDLDREAVSRGACEREPVIEAGVLLVDELGLGDSGLEVDVPQRRGLLPVGLAPCQEAQEAALGRPPRGLADRRVVLGPVDRCSELAEQVLEGPLVLGDEDVAEIHEIGREMAPARAFLSRFSW